MSFAGPSSSVVLDTSIESPDGDGAGGGRRAGRPGRRRGRCRPGRKARRGTRAGRGSRRCAGATCTRANKRNLAWYTWRIASTWWCRRLIATARWPKVPVAAIFVDNTLRFFGTHHGIELRIHMRIYQLQRRAIWVRNWLAAAANPRHDVFIRRAHTHPHPLLDLHVEATLYIT